MNRGLYRDSSGWVMVEYTDGRQGIPIPRNTYEANGYQPPYDKLPTKEEYEKRNAQRS